MLARRAAKPTVWTERARRGPTVSYVRDRVRLGPGLLTHRTYPMGRCRCAEHPAKLSVIANLARTDAGPGVAVDVTYSSRTKESGAAAVDRLVDRAVGATSAIGALSGTTPWYLCR